MNAETLAGLQRELGGLGRPYQTGDVAVALRRMGIVVSHSVLLEVLDQLRRNSLGAGPLEGLLREPGVSDVVVNGMEGVFVDRGSGLEPAPVSFGSDEEVRRLAIRLAAAAGRRLDDSQPFVDGRLPGGVRLHAVLAPVASPGTSLSLRVPAAQSLRLADLLERGTLTTEMLCLLGEVVDHRVPYLISGGTGSGKTTLLAAMLATIAPRERIVIVEDARELTPDHPHCVRLEGRPANTEGVGAITLTALVRQALRMRPDRLVVGEVRGAELADLLAALNTGHEGGCGTIHANSLADVPARLEALGALGGLDRVACHAQAVAALRLVIHIHRRPDGQRVVTDIGVVTRGETGLEVLPALSITPEGQRRGPGARALDTLLGRS
ncbi:MAG: TadA family conjugal transfer-associated ATPase [Arachnia sp.]